MEDSMKALIGILIFICLAGTSSQAGHRFVDQAGDRIPDFGNLDTADFYISKIDTLEFKKVCSTIVNVDSVKNVKTTVERCHWNAVTDTTFSTKFILLLSKPQLDWFMKWLQDAMKPPVLRTWGVTFDTLYDISRPDWVYANTSGGVSANSVLMMDSAGLGWARPRDSVTIDTIGMEKIR